ncbi:MAG: NAD-binding protein [Candidatus Brocadiia bacterium]|nr:TrkA family potassium uptake protein [Planctomycetota bacterium]
MYIVIAGAGMVGGTLARRLLQNRHDVVVVEQDKEVCEEMTQRVGVLAVHGTATDFGVLQDAGIEKAEVAIGALPRDADNLAFTILARSSDVPRIVARMRNPVYESAYEMAGVTRTLDIGQLFVDQLVLEIEHPTLRQVATFGRGEASVVVATIPEGGRVDGKAVSEVGQNKRFPEECVIAGVYREADERFIIPRGKIKLRAGDQVFLAASTENVREAAQFLQRTK